MTKGRFIVFEGIDGSGKTTQAKAMEKWLSDQGISVWRTAEPTDSQIGRQIRSLLCNDLAEEDREQLRLLFRQDRIQHIFEEKVGIGARLEAGQWVLCDRYIYSTLAYQGDMSQKFLEEELYASNFVIQPDVVVYISLDTVEAHQRLLERKEQLSMFETCTRLESIRKNYWKLFGKPSNPLHHLDLVKKVIQVQGHLDKDSQTRLIKNILTSQFPELQENCQV